MPTNSGSSRPGRSVPSRARGFQRSHDEIVGIRGLGTARASSSCPPFGEWDFDVAALVLVAECPARTQSPAPLPSPPSAPGSSPCRASPLAAPPGRPQPVPVVQTTSDGEVERLDAGLRVATIGAVAGLLRQRWSTRNAARVTIRMATADDAAFLAEMLAVAADWRPGTTPRTVSDVIGDPDLAHYIRDWPIEGDVGVLAEADVLLAQHGGDSSLPITRDTGLSTLRYRSCPSAWSNELAAKDKVSSFFRLLSRRDASSDFRRSV